MRASVLPSAAAAATLVIFTPRAAPAAEPSLTGARLDYVRGPGAESCTGEEGLRDAVATQMGGVDPFTATAAKHVVVTITRPHRDFQGEFTLYDADGSIVGTHPVPGGAGCNALIQDLALSLSLTLRPFLLPTDPTAPSPPSPPPPPPTRPAPHLAPSPPAPASTQPHVRVGVGAVVAFGLSPSVAMPGFGGLVGVRWPLVSLTLEGRADLPASLTDQGHGVAVRTSLTSGSFAPTLHWRWLFGGAVISVGGLHVTATNASPSEQIETYVGVGPRVGAEVPFAEHFAAQFVGDLLFAAARPQVLIAQTPLWTTSLAAGLLGIRLVASF